MIRIKTPGGEFTLPFSYDAVAELKRFARFDTVTKTWHADYLPCSFATRFLRGAAVECFSGRWWRGFAFLEREPPRDAVCYAVQRWRRVGCGEYCEERCDEQCDTDRCAERCVDSCVDRCEREGWTPRVREEEEVCLAKKTERGDWQVPRGLVPLLDLRLPRYAPDLGGVDAHPDLRPYQVDVLHSVWNRLAEVGAATVQMATGAGKSFLSGWLARKLQERGYAVFVTALQLDLVAQLRRFAERFGASVHAVTVQTLYRRVAGRSVADDAEDGEEAEVLKAYADEHDVEEDVVDLFRRGRKVAVVVDEAHHVPARTIKTVLSEAAGGWALRVGLSATPWRNDGRDLEIYAYVGAVVEPRITSSYLIQHGYAVPVEIRVVEAPDCGVEVEGNGASAWAEEVRQLVECDSRNRLIVELVRRAEKPALVLTQRVKHAELLGKMLREAGVGAEVVTGAVKGELRQRIYEQLAAGGVEALVATQLADEGLDLPPLRTLVIALGGKSKTRTLQRVGRLVRPWRGKDMAVAYELSDPGTSFSRAHLEERLKLYKTEPAWAVRWVKGTKLL